MCFMQKPMAEPLNNLLLNIKNKETHRTKILDTQRQVFGRKYKETEVESHFYEFCVLCG